MTNETKIEKNKKIELALSAIMFFAPFIKGLIKKEEFTDANTKNFVLGFIKIGYINIGLLSLSILLWIISYFKQINIFQTISTILLILLGLVLIIGCYCAISEKAILNTDHKESSPENIKENILYFIPIYNIYLRYQRHNFEQENHAIKNGILLRTLFTISMFLFQGHYINVILFIRILFIMICHINGLNVVKTNHIFKKNPEEIMGYINGFLYTIFNKKSLKDNIKEQKKSFEFLFKLENKQIFLEYIVLSLIMIYIYYIGIKSENLYILYGATTITARYLIMFIKWKHLPHLPFLKGGTDIFFRNKNEIKGKNL